jgi:hypothetical protein
MAPASVLKRKVHPILNRTAALTTANPQTSDRFQKASPNAAKVSGRQQGYEDLPERPVGGEVLPFRGKHLVDGRARVLRSGEPEHAGYQREEGERDVPQRLHL